MEAMKKIVSLLLCLMLLLGVSALAETADKEEIGSLEINGEFILKAALPEGYTLHSFDSDSLMSIWYVSSDDPARPVMSLVIAFDEAYADVDRLNDLDDEALAELVGTWTMEYDMEISYAETAYGTKLIVAKEIGDYADYVSFFSIYKGYCVEFTLIGGNAGEDALTDEQVQMAIDFLSDLDFVPVAAE